MNFLDILVALFFVLFIILLPILIFGYRNGIAAKSKDHHNRGCWKALFIIALIIFSAIIIGVLLLILLFGALSGSFS